MESGSFASLILRLKSRRLPAPAVAFVGLLFMPTLIPYVGTGLDPSWSIALNLAVSRGLEFGRDIVFTFGPLGFLVSPALSVPKLGVIAMVLRFALSLVFGWLVARALMRTIWWPVAAICTWYLQWAVVGGSSGGAEIVLVPVLVLFLGLVDALATRNRPVGALTLVACGTACSTALLTKFDTGLFSLLIAGGFVLAEGVVLRRPLRAVAVSALTVCAAAAGSIVLWWSVLGQSLRLLPRWLWLNIDVVLGYQAAMVTDAPVRRSATHSIVTVVLVVLAGACLLVALRRDGRRVAMMCALMLVTLVIFAKQSFTRYDNGHLQRLNTGAAVVLVAVVAGWSRNGTGTGRGTADAEVPDLGVDGPESTRAVPATVPSRLRAVRMMFVVVALAGSMYCAQVGAQLVSAPKPDTSSWLSTAKLALSGSRREAVVTRQRTLLPRELSIPPEVRSALSEGGVHIEPAETSIAWIFPEIRWRPLPVIQSYSAYTPALDNLNAKAYAKRGGPDIVLYQAGFRVDNRMARFESPAAQLAFVCNFRPRVLTELWQVFVRRSDGSGCSSEAEDLGTLDARLREKVVLPSLPDDSVVVATFSGFSPSPGQIVRSAVLRAPKYWFELGSPDPGEPAHRFVAGTASQPHIVSVPQCLRGRWSTYDTRTFSSFVLRDSEWPRADPEPGMAFQVHLRAYRYNCPT